MSLHPLKSFILYILVTSINDSKNVEMKWEGELEGKKKTTKKRFPCKIERKPLYPITAVVLNLYNLGTHTCSWSLSHDPCSTTCSCAANQLWAANMFGVLYLPYKNFSRSSAWGLCWAYVPSICSLLVTLLCSSYRGPVRRNVTSFWPRHL